MIKKNLIPFLFLILLYNNSNAQLSNVNAGGYIGIGEIRGNSPSLTSLNMNLFIDFTTSFFEDLSFRFNFFYGRKVEYYLPENRQGKYYPFVKSFGIKAYMRQELGGALFAEEGLGPVILNDRTFSDTNVWNYGIAFNALAGIDFRGFESSGFTLGLGAEFAGTFNNTRANYYSAHIQTQYYF